MVLPLKSKEDKFLVEINGKELMLYLFVEHKVFDEVDIEINKVLEVLNELFDTLAEIQIPVHPFKTYNNWFERGVSQLRKKIKGHTFLDQFEEYFNGRFTELEFLIGNTHFDLNPFNIWLNNKNKIFISDFDNAQVGAYAKDIFDICSKYVTVSNGGVNINEKDLDAIFNFSKRYIKNISIRDVRYLLVRPKLGPLFDPKSNLTEIEIFKKLDDFLAYCSDS
jgi:thiamine kinase-like enzyme